MRLRTRIGHAVRDAIDARSWSSDNEAYCQPCVSPVWDTVLALLSAPRGGPAQYLRSRARALRVAGAAGPDTVRPTGAARPHVAPGGWAFQYANPHYPDLDDTAVAAVALALDRFAGLNAF